MTRGAVRIKVFGSMANDTAAPDSDVDMLVEFKERCSAFALGGLLVDLQNLLGRKVDVVTPASIHPQIRQSILEQAVEL